MRVDSPIGLPFYYISRYGHNNIIRYIEKIYIDGNDKISIEDYIWFIKNNELLFFRIENPNMFITNYRILSSNNITFERHEVHIITQHIRDNIIDNLLS